MTEARHRARMSRVAPALGVLLGFWVATSWSPCAAQVGYPPDRSPYRDIRSGGTAVLGFGYLGGSRGSVGVGPSDGNVWSVRYELPLGRTFGVTVEGADALTTRFVLDPTKDATIRTTGPVQNSLAIVDLGFQMVLTGGKTWHGFAPFVGAKLGVAIANRLASDTSQYNFGTKVTFGPEAGFRLYLGRQLSLRADATLLFWKLSYPLEYRVPPTTCSGAGCNSVLGPTDALSEWARERWLDIRLGWTF
jgi:hypothetical protein